MSDSSSAQVKTTAPAKTPAPGTGAFAAILGLLIVVAFSDVVTGAGTFFHRDFGIFGYPLAAYHREAFWRGEIPLWNPLSNCGLPFLAQWNTLCLYPPALIYLLPPLSYSLGIFCLAHQFLGGLGMYLLSREWTKDRLAGAVAGIGFAFGGLTLSCIKWPNNISALAWMPWMFLLSRRAWREGGRWVVLAGVAGGMQMLTGAPEVILFTWAGLGVFWLGEFVPRRQEAKRVTVSALVLRAGLVAGLTAGLAAAQLLPFLELLGASQRGEGFRTEVWSMPTWGWANLVVPLFRSFASHQGVYAQIDQFWTSSYYPGIGLLLLGLIALGTVRRREVWMASFLVLGSLALAVGNGGPLYPLAMQWVPGLGLIRFPVKFIILAAFLIPLLAGWGLARITRGDEPGEEGSSDSRPGRSDWKWILGVGLLMMVIIGAVLWFDSTHPLAPSNGETTRISGLSRIGILAGFCLACLGLGSKIPLERRRLAVGGLLLLVWGDLMTQAPRLNPTIPRWAYEPGLAAKEQKWEPLPAPGGARAMLSAFAEERLNHLSLTNAVEDFLHGRMALFANANLLENVPKVDGFYSLYLKEENELRSILYSSTNANFPRMLDLMAVAQISAPGKMIEWQARPTARPFASAGQRPVFADRDATLNSLTSPDFKPGEEVYLTPEAKVGFQREAAVARVRSRSFSAQRMVYEVESDKPTFLVLANAFYAPWRAEVNGQPTTILRANHAFQAVPVPAGRSEVKLVYRDRAFEWGAGVSVFSVAMAGLGWARCGRPATRK